ncbi:N-acetyllactosaminide beta-1,6-N-acetylglucosaminyl-transferase-like [Diadema antillarum]|uniref:N-acetyllactosaminide beta-1,6-N-acetylglucosaminyl-transferase-like n=1 Tax=Diadema antillarum TaxID=105358 RepID=UPI003A86D084
MSRVCSKRFLCWRSPALKRACSRKNLFLIAVCGVALYALFSSSSPHVGTSQWLYPQRGVNISPTLLTRTSSVANDSLTRNGTLRADGHTVQSQVNSSGSVTSNGTKLSINAPMTYHKHFDVNCEGIIKGDHRAIQSASVRLKTSRYHIPDNQAVKEWTNDCDLYRRARKFPTSPLSLEEADFPIAYIIVTHTDLSQTERLLRAVYQPQNVYCIHPDKKSPPPFQDAVRSLAACFPNVFIVSNPVGVNYAHSSRLQADINCMADLLERKESWKYVINLCGQDFPLKTNLGIVRKLKGLRGRNDIPGIIAPKWFDHRTRVHHEFRQGMMVKLPDVEKPPPPQNFTFYFGNAYYAATRGYVQYVIHNKTAIELLQYSEDAYSPDEHYWVTLHRIPGVPGGVVGSSWESIVRFVKWKGTPKFPECVGKYVRNICIFGAGYVHHLASQVHLFANKFHMSYDPIAMQCMEKFLEDRTNHPS